MVHPWQMTEVFHSTELAAPPGASIEYCEISPVASNSTD
jgi:hypothetical protein